MDGTQNMKRPSLAVIASSLAILGGAATAAATSISCLSVGWARSTNEWKRWNSGSRGGFSTFRNRGLPGHFHNPPRPRKRCQRRGRR